MSTVYSTATNISKAVTNTIDVYFREEFEEDHQKRYFGSFRANELKDVDTLFATFPTVFADTGEVAQYVSSQVKTLKGNTYFEVVVRITHRGSIKKEHSEHPLLQSVHNHINTQYDESENENND